MSTVTHQTVADGGPLLANLVAAAMHADDPSGTRAADVELTLLKGLPHQLVTLTASEDIFREGEMFSQACVLVEGWACRYKLLPDGRRQIIGFVLPGDLCSSWIAGDSPIAHGVKALSHGRMIKVDRSDIFDSLEQHSALIERLSVNAAQEHIILGAWLLNIGQRKAPERIAHLFCELATRMRKLGLKQMDGGYEVPLTQMDLADALGLTSVHVNRVLQKLRDRGFIDFRRGVLSIRDVPALCAYVEFKDGYLLH